MRQFRKLSVIAQDICDDWSNWAESFARDYILAMRELNSVDDDYYCDSGRFVVRYFLANAGGWRGAKAREIKAELRAMVD